MASIVLQADLSVENEAKMEQYRTHLERLSGTFEPLCENGIRIGDVLRDPSAAKQPMLSILVSSWDSAAEELHRFVLKMLCIYYFDGISAIGLK